MDMTQLIDQKNFEYIVALLVLTGLMCLICFFYAQSIKKCTTYSKMPRFTFLIFSVVQWIKRNAYQIVGKSYKVAVPFFIYIMTLFWLSNIIAILGFEALGNRLEIPATLALVVFIGTVLSGLIHRGYHFLGDYLVWIKIGGRKVIPIIDPLKFIGEMSRVLSLTFRLWGNTLAGSLILFVVYHCSQSLLRMGDVEYLGPVLLPLFVFPLHIYFDIIGGTIQPMIFMLLTMCYWALARHGEGAPNNQHDVAER